MRISQRWRQVPGSCVHTARGGELGVTGQARGLERRGEGPSGLSWLIWTGPRTSRCCKVPFDENGGDSPGPFLGAGCVSHSGQCQHAARARQVASASSLVGRSPLQGGGGLWSLLSCGRSAPETPWPVQSCTNKNGPLRKTVGSMAQNLGALAATAPPSQ